MLHTSRLPALFGLLMLLSACVTINVYFPAAAAQEAADLIIRDVYGEGQKKEAPDATQSPQSNLTHQPPLLLTALNWMIAPAQAAADISVQTPAIRALQASMKQRHNALEAHYASGAIGMTIDGLLDIRDLSAVALKERRAVQKLVGDENRDRDTLYAEIARANGHPEWEAEIRSTFARRWVDNAPRGWWYETGKGAWKQK